MSSSSLKINMTTMVFRESLQRPMCHSLLPCNWCQWKPLLALWLQPSHHHRPTKYVFKRQKNKMRHFFHCLILDQLPNKIPPTSFRPGENKYRIRKYCKENRISVSVGKARVSNGMKNRQQDVPRPLNMIESTYIFSSETQILPLLQIFSVE